MMILLRPRRLVVSPNDLLDTQHGGLADRRGRLHEPRRAPDVADEGRDDEPDLDEEVVRFVEVRVRLRFVLGDVLRDESGIWCRLERDQRRHEVQGDFETSVDVYELLLVGFAPLRGFDL